MPSENEQSQTWRHKPFLAPSGWQLQIEYVWTWLRTCADGSVVLLALLPLAGPQQFSSSTHDSRLEMCIKGNVCTQVDSSSRPFKSCMYVYIYIYSKPFINWMWIIPLKNNTNIPITYASKKCFCRWMCMHSWRHVLFGKPNPAQQQPLNQCQSFIQWSCDPPRNWSSLQETHPNQNQKQSHETYQIYPNLTSEE